MPSSAAMRSSSASCSRFELGDRAPQRVALAGLRVGVAPHLAGLGVGERRLRDERPQPGVLGLVLEERALLVGDRELRAQPLEAVAHVDEAALRAGSWTSGPGSLRRGPRPGMWQRGTAAEHAPRRSSPPSTRSCGRRVRRFVDTEVRPHVDEWERAGHFPDSLFRRCGELGFLGLHYPARFGGSDGDLAAGLVFVEELARCGAGAIPMAISVQIAHGHTRARRSSAPTTSASAGSRPRSPARRSARSRSPSPTPAPTSPRSAPAPCATATCGASTAARCSSPTARARTSSRSSPRPTPTAGHRGISLFIVDTSLPGVSVSRQLEKLGMHSSDTAEIALDDVRGPARRPHRPRTRPGLRAADVAAAVRTARGRGRVGRPRGAGARRHDRVRARAQDVRPADRAAPGDRAQARRRRDRARSRARRCSTRPRGA